MKKEANKKTIRFRVNTMHQTIIQTLVFLKKIKKVKIFNLYFLNKLAFLSRRLKPTVFQRYKKQCDYSS